MTDTNLQKRRERSGVIRALPFLFALALSPATAEESAIPHVSKQAKQSYGYEYRHAVPHKAFAIAPGGGWSWRSGAADPDAAAQAAIEACAQHTAQPCVAYDIDGEIVLDRDTWPTLWRPYPSAEEAATRPVGTGHGERLPNLAFRDRDGQPKTLADFHGQVVIVHFWGSWCPPCMREFPSLLQFQADVKQALGDEVAMVLLQTGEPFKDSLRWATRNDFAALPLYDSGINDGDQTQLTTADGQTLPDRALAPVFPSSYVLDRNGVILLRHKGPIHDWSEYLPFFRDLVVETSR